ncbi:glycosyl hydrolase family 8 [Clostridium septicum]|uniref:Glycosyl hydrolase n=1 Tax=Clostridium septicum TaxID=1504 RepID=A0A9N7JK64_CLOSE|nr:glycosyl hydrolase family 8 [Clostridium septicum]AYE33337.1 glycosyl hydrolase [Clostridium septicum]QAS61507.1 glycosyl hydrolase [Clostridium septicum]UEC22056.1 glycosyl hydrolase [Clostridium septicum]USR99911.1 glycosyl hydrolase family 8 [Clostridium septicum]
MKKRKILIVLALIIFIILGVGINFSMEYLKPIKVEPVLSKEVYTNEEEILLKFLQNNLMDSEGGVYTNLKDKENEGDITKGHSILSESQGILLMYYLYSGDEENFERIFNYIKNKMILDNNLISWRIENGEPSKVSATIDDLRIAKALILASKEFNNFKYRYYGVNISQGIYENLVHNENLIDFKDEFGKSKESTLCYLDLPAIKLLSQIDNKWRKIYDNSLKIINGGLISEDLPLYRKKYNTNDKLYDNEEVDSLLSMLVILNKSEAGEDVSKSIEWIKNQLKEKGYISSLYNIETGEESKIESTSIYSNIVEIAKVIGDRELYELAFNKMKIFQVNNKDSKIYGAFGDEKSEMVYSYDNLNSLLSFRRNWK